jgi:hypothetical protein
MINPEGMPMPEEELTGEKPESAETEQKKETPAEYANELRKIISETNAKISDMERQRKLKIEIIAHEQDAVELLKMTKEYSAFDDEMFALEEKLNDATIALETTAELGIKLPKPEEKMPEFDINVDDLDNHISEALEALTEITEMNDLLTQRENLKKQLKEAAASKDEARFNELTDSYILLSKEIEALARKEKNTAIKVETLREIKDMAA